MRNGERHATQIERERERNDGIKIKKKERYRSRNTTSERCGPRLPMLLLGLVDDSELDLAVLRLGRVVAGQRHAERSVLVGGAAGRPLRNQEFRVRLVHLLDQRSQQQHLVVEAGDLGRRRHRQRRREAAAAEAGVLRVSIARVTRRHCPVETEASPR